MVNDRSVKVAAFIEKLTISDRIRRQAGARYDRLVKGGRDAGVAQRMVTAWALAEQRQLDEATNNDPWLARAV